MTHTIVPIGRSPMNPTIAFVGARGGHGTTTVAASVALHLARHGRAVLVSDPAPAAALLGIGPLDPDAAIAPVTAGLDLATAGIEGIDPAGVEGAVVVVDEGTIADPTLQPGPDWRVDERYLVLRGPCYVALTTVLAAGVEGIDGIVLVEEANRSLTAADVTDVLGVPVAATVTAGPKVARTIDAGLLPARIGSLRDLAALRTLARPTPAAASPQRTGPPPPERVTDLPLSLCDNGGRVADRQKRVALWGPRPNVGGVWRPSPGCRRAEHRAPGPRSGRLLRRRGRHLGGGLLLGAG